MNVFIAEQNEQRKLIFNLKVLRQGAISQTWGGGCIWGQFLYVTIFFNSA